MLSCFEDLPETCSHHLQLLWGGFQVCTFVQGEKAHLLSLGCQEQSLLDMQLQACKSPFKVKVHMDLCRATPAEPGRLENQAPEKFQGEQMWIHCGTQSNDVEE